MGAGGGEGEEVVVDLVEEQPVGREVAVAVTGPITFEGVVLHARGQGNAVRELEDGFMHFVQVVTPAGHALEALDERRGLGDIAHGYLPQVAKRALMELKREVLPAAAARRAAAVAGLGAPVREQRGQAGTGRAGGVAAACGIRKKA